MGTTTIAAASAGTARIPSEHRGRLPSVAVRMAIVGVPVLIASTLVMHLRTGGSDLTSWWLGDVALAAVLLIPGALVAAKRPGNVIGWLLLTASVTTAIAGAGREYLVLGFLGGAAPGYIGIGWLTDSLSMVSMGMLPLLLMVFPDGHLLSRRTRYWVAVPLLSILLGTFGMLFSADATGVDVQGRRLYHPARDVFPAWVADGAATLSWMLFLAGVVAAIALLVLRYRRAGTEVRLQMKWVVWAGSIGLVELATELIPGNEISTYTGPVASALLTASVCVAILRHRLFDIDLVINRTVVYAVLSAGVVGLYVAVVVAAGALLDEPVEVGPGLLAAAVVALVFGPARARLQNRVDRMMYGDRRNPYRVISQLGRRLESARGADELRVVVQTVAQTLKLPYAGIVDPSGGMLAEYGTTVGTPFVVELPYQGMPVGRLLISQRPHQSGFDRGELRLLDDLARQIGAAVHAVRLSADLQASRARLVNAKEEERRRLRRDLHDGLGPELAALGLKVDAALALADERPESSKRLMCSVKDDIGTTIADIRRLVYNLRPPALDELGLVGALREAAGRFDDAGTNHTSTDTTTAAGITTATEPTPTPRITLTAPDRLPLLPAAVEVAAYRIVTEALTNAVRHARAEWCQVRISMQSDHGPMCVQVVDDGVGLPDGWRPGVGMSSMRERAEELGGRLTIRSGADGVGTEVDACLPCGSQQC